MASRIVPVIDAPAGPSSAATNSASSCGLEVAVGAVEKRAGEGDAGRVDEAVDGALESRKGGACRAQIGEIRDKRVGARGIGSAQDGHDAIPVTRQAFGYGAPDARCRAGDEMGTHGSLQDGARARAVHGRGWVSLPPCPKKGMTRSVIAVAAP